MNWWSDLWRYGFTTEQQRFSKAAEHYSRSITAYEEELRQLPIDEAQQASARLLQAPRTFRVQPWTGLDRTDLAGLTRQQQAIFRQARRIEALNGEPYVDAAELGPYEWDAGLTRIGTDSEHAFILIRPGEETVYVVDETEALDLGKAQQFQTLSHWVLWLERSGQLLSSRDEPAA